MQKRLCHAKAKRFRRTPLWRSHPAGMRRNAQVVLKNLAD